MDLIYMKKCIEMSIENINNNGGPFAAIIVQNKKIVGQGCNSVTSNNDPTAHAEIMAIRDACNKLNVFTLQDCTIYTSCEPCPMCFAAIYWARISRVVYGNTRHDAAKIDFDDEFIYRELALDINKRTIPVTQVLRDDAHKAFILWKNKCDKIPY